MIKCCKNGKNNSSLTLVLLFTTLVVVVDCFASHRQQRQLLSLRDTSLFCSTTESLLREHGFGQRLKTLSHCDLPLTAELHDHGAWELCQIIQLEPPSKPGSHPRIKVQVKDEKRIVDLGQITTIWWSNGQHDPTLHDHIEPLPLQHLEQAMQQLYHNYSRQQQKSTKGTSSLTKKSISKIVAKVKDIPDRLHAEEVFRKVLKAGEGMVRLVDSALAMDYVYDQEYPKTDDEFALRRTVGGYAIAQDALIGGRFKRMSCVFVSAKSTDDGQIDSITFVNGGWLVVDQNIRDGTEARKFAQRTQEGSQLVTAADERIAQRLECLAMGEVFGARTDDNELEVDVREFLKALDLPSSPEGAQQALVRIGRWSSGLSTTKLEPWSNDTLSAARAYADADLVRRKILSRQGLHDDVVDLEGRLDLTSLPAVCIDAKTTTFRDDAIGVRPRSGTGRKVVREASNWEILVHIADVSDIYSPEHGFLDSATLNPLRAAAISRGMSRYDLPLGPLHLLPPTVLKSLGFFTYSSDVTDSAKLPNRCVTLWAYIDERNGKLLDAGIERTLISAPFAFNYESASRSLDERENLHTNKSMSKATSVLALAERNLQLWSDHYKQSSEAARKREQRLSAKEIVDTQNRNGFVRTRGHRLVDMALDLYGVAVSKLLRSKKAPIPRASGSGSDRMGRVATAPLRRYVDGMAQRQILSVLCGYGGKPLTVDECQKINAEANDAMDRLANLRPLKYKSSNSDVGIKLALTQLQAKRNRVIKAISTGRGNEVSIEGAVGKCHGINRNLKAGEVVSVRVQVLNVEKGIVTFELVK